MSRFRNQGYSNSGVRIDARPKNSVSSQAGIRGAHYGMGGEMIGGYAKGKAFGTKLNGGRSGPMPSQRATSPTGTAPATGNILNQRQSLFRNMEAAGQNGLTDDMRKKARSLGVSDDSFNSAASRIKGNAAPTAPANAIQPVAQPGIAPANQQPQPVARNAEPKTQWEMDRFQRLQKQDEMRSKGMNPQTGLAMGADVSQVKPKTPLVARETPEYGADTANANIKSMGQEGATADYFKRAAAEKEQLAAKKAAAKQSRFRSDTAINAPNSVSTAPPMAPSPFPAPAMPKVAMPDAGKIAGKVVDGVSSLAGKAVKTVQSGIGAVSSAMETLPKPQAGSTLKSPNQMTPAAATAKAAMGDTSNDTMTSSAASLANSQALKAKEKEFYRKRNEATVIRNRKAREARNKAVDEPGNVGFLPEDSIAASIFRRLQKSPF